MKRRMRPALAFTTVMAALAAGCATAPRPLHARALALQAAGVEALGRGQLDRAAGHFALALEYEPRIGEAENGLGLVALRRGDWARAEERFHAALAINEDLAEAHLNLATVLVHRDRSGVRRCPPADRRAAAPDRQA
jgi:tetratricopeptide (TPR) repeat protein